MVLVRRVCAIPLLWVAVLACAPAAVAPASGDRDRNPPVALMDPATASPVSASASPTVAPTAAPTAEPSGDVLQPRLAADGVLAPDAAKRFRSRAIVLGTVPKVYWRRSAVMPANFLSAGKPLRYPVELVVAEVHEHRVRFVDEDSSIRYAAFVRRDALREVITTTTRLVPDKGAPQPPLGITVAPGFRPEWGEATSERRSLEFMAHEVRFEGSVDASTVGRVFEPKPFAVPEANRSVFAETSVLNRPGGVPFAVLAPVDQTGTNPVQPHVPVDVVEERGGYSRVVLVAPRYRVEGWVPTSALTTTMAGGGYGMSGMGAGGGGGPVVTLGTGTRLFAYPKGPQIGVVIEDLRTSLGDADQGWRAIRFHGNDVGELKAWVAPETARTSLENTRLMERSAGKVEFLHVRSVTGLPKPIAEREMILRVHHVRRCYVDAERAGRPPAGLLGLSFVFTSQGEVLSVSASGPAAASVPFKRCVERRFRRAGLPPAEGGSGYLRAEFEIAPSPSSP
jgi:hypothetical protein